MLDKYDYKNNHIDGQKVDLDLKTGNYLGQVLNLPNKIYHSLPQISSTQHKYIYANSPAHYKSKYIDNPQDTSLKSSSALLGSVTHAAVLTPNELPNEFSIMPDMDMRTKAAKEVYAGAVAASAGKIVIKEEMLKMAQDMAESVMSNRHARNLLEGSRTEVAYFWRCPVSSLNFKSKVDAVKDGVLIELKTAMSANPAAFERQAYNMNYDLSVAHYLQGLQLWTNRQTSDVYFIVVENTSPYVCQVYRASDEFIISGHNKWLSSTDKLEKGYINNEWPGYSSDSDEVLTLNPPKWSIKREEKVFGSDEENEISGAW
jgi:hypothetical protein